MRTTHAIIVRIPNFVRFEKKVKVDLALARKQLDQLTDVLREAGVNIVELSPDEDCVQHSLFTGDAAICINGTALVTRPHHAIIRLNEVVSVLKDLAWQVIETPANEHGKQVVLEASDVLFTGKELFVGVRKNGTNIEGALVVGRTFSDLNVVPISLPGSLPLRHYISLITDEVLVVGSSKEAKQVLQRMERQAAFRYKTLSVDQDEAVCCLKVNNCVIHRQDTPDTKIQILQDSVQMVGVNIGELIKIGDPFSRFCLLAQKMKGMKSVC